MCCDNIFTMKNWLPSIYFLLLFTSQFISLHSQDNDTLKSCNDLLPGQYRCNKSLDVDPETQSVVECENTHTVKGINVLQDAF